LTYPVKSPIVLGVLSLENLSNWLLKEKNQVGSSSLQGKGEDNATGITDKMVGRRIQAIVSYLGYWVVGAWGLSY